MALSTLTSLAYSGRAILATVRACINSCTAVSSISSGLPAFCVLIDNTFPYSEKYPRVVPMPSDAPRPTCIPIYGFMVCSLNRISAKTSKYGLSLAIFLPSSRYDITLPIELSTKPLFAPTAMRLGSVSPSMYLSKLRSSVENVLGSTWASAIGVVSAGVSNDTSLALPRLMLAISRGVNPV